MAQVLAIANQKGGVGKTTTSVNVACALARLNQRVLLVDLDPQGNATMGSGVDKRTLAASVYQVLIGEVRAREAIVAQTAAGYALLPANRELAGAELDLVELEARETRLRDALAEVDTDFDLVIIDCPPSLSLLTLNGFCAASGVIIPMQCEYYALEGLSDLVNTVRKVHANFNRQLGVLGLLRVMFDPRIALSQQVSRQLEAHFGDKVFATLVPRNVRLAEAPSHGLPGVLYDPQSKGAQAYLEFARELLARLAGQSSAKPRVPAASSTAAAPDTPEH
jgi:chromosome partitioning protein